MNNTQSTVKECKSCIYNRICKFAEHKECLTKQTHDFFIRQLNEKFNSKDWHPFNFHIECNQYKPIESVNETLKSKGIDVVNFGRD